jgi:hypothetical protein
VCEELFPLVNLFHIEQVFAPVELRQMCHLLGVLQLDEDLGQGRRIKAYKGGSNLGISLGNPVKRKERVVASQRTVSFEWLQMKKSVELNALDSYKIRTDLDDGRAMVDSRAIGMNK